MVNFLFPNFLWALLALAVPIVIHLFHFRRFKKVYFSNVAFLKNIQVTTQNRRQLKRWLILASRCLALMFLVLAFAQPFIPDLSHQNSGKVNAVSIYIDNSFSMNAEGKEGNLLITARQKARELANSFKETDKFQLLTNDFEGRHQHLVSREEFLQWVDEVKPSPATRNITAVQKRQIQALDNAGDARKLIFILSDFQKYILNNYMPLKDSTIISTWVPFQANTEKNLTIDSCYFETPYVKKDGTNKLTVVISNYGEDAVENGSVSLTINGQQKTVGGFTVKAHDKTEAHLSFTTTQSGWQAAQLSLVDNPITFDDKLYFSFKVNASTDIYIINQVNQNNYIPQVYATDNYFKTTLSSISQIDYSQLKKAGLVVLNGCEEYSSGLSEELKNYIQNGGDLMVFPTAKSESIQSLNNFLSAFQMGVEPNFVEQTMLCEKINLQSYIFNDAFEKPTQEIDLPLTKKYISLRFSGGTHAEPLLTLKNGKPFLSVSHQGRGKLYICASPLESEYTNFGTHAVFVPFMLKAALASADIPPIFHRIGKDQYIPLQQEIAKTEGGVKLTDGKFEMIPEIISRNGSSILYMADAMKEAGNYILKTQGNDQPILSFNYTTEESDMSYLNESELESVAPENVLVSNEDKVNKTVHTLDGSIRLWRYCIYLTLLFVLIEVVLIKWLK